MILLSTLLFVACDASTTPSAGSPSKEPAETSVSVEKQFEAEHTKYIAELKSRVDNPDGLFDYGEARELQLTVSKIATETCADVSIEFSFDARSNQAAWRCGTHSGGFTIGKELHLKVELDADKNDVYPYRVCGEGLATILVSPNREEVTIRCPKQSDYRVPDGPFNNYVIPSPF